MEENMDGIPPNKMFSIVIMLVILLALETVCWYKEETRWANDMVELTGQLTDIESQLAQTNNGLLDRLEQKADPGIPLSNEHEGADIQLHATPSPTPIDPHGAR